MERIRTKHPDPTREGAEMDKKTYVEFKEALVRSFRRNGKMEYDTIKKSIAEQLTPFEDQLDYYLRIVLLDLEAEGEIAKSPDTNPFIYEDTGLDD